MRRRKNPSDNTFLWLALFGLGGYYLYKSGWLSKILAGPSSAGAPRALPPWQQAPVIITRPNTVAAPPPPGIIVQPSGPAPAAAAPTPPVSFTPGGPLIMQPASITPSLPPQPPPSGTPVYQIGARSPTGYPIPTNAPQGPTGPTGSGYVWKHFYDAGSSFIPDFILAYRWNGRNPAPSKAVLDQTSAELQDAHDSYVYDFGDPEGDFQFFAFGPGVGQGVGVPAGAQRQDYATTTRPLPTQVGGFYFRDVTGAASVPGYVYAGSATEVLNKRGYTYYIGWSGGGFTKQETVGEDGIPISGREASYLIAYPVKGLTEGNVLDWLDANQGLINSWEGE